MSFRDEDARALSRAVTVARAGISSVEPNPPVGAVLYRGREILAQGLHRAFGALHAERDLLSRWQDPVADDVTMAVTLEPCCTTGKQPPCTDAIVQAGIRRVVVGEVDPFPDHAGRGLEVLAEAGVEVVVAPEGAVPGHLLAAFRRHLERRRPYVVAKWACGLDGRWSAAAGRQEWISGPVAQAEVHRLRAQVDAILLGSETVLIDDPTLNARPAGRRTLWRIVVDARGRLTLNERLFRSPEAGPVLLVSQQVRDVPPGTELLRVDDVHDLENSVLPELRRRGIQKLMVEGGATLLSSFLNAGLIDRAWVFVAPILFSTVQRAPAVGYGPAPLTSTQRPRVESLQRRGDDAWFQLVWP